MYNSQLTVFVCVADCGSFARAASALCISPTAVMKQMNTLEAHLGLKLIGRSSHGIRLTPAGEVICRYAKFLFDYSRRSIENARQAMQAHGTTFCVGISLEDDHEGILSEIAGLGETLMMVKQGDSEVNDQNREDIRKNHPRIRIGDTPQFYDISVFNRCAETGNVLLTLECWEDERRFVEAVKKAEGYCAADEYAGNL
ncbi:MAG TPA: LysR family transcriptional regulator [Candidatus Eisenbergiella merdipullorum]|uniref:LysR family transcriptional regulator n=1 Tax=Candidatus Eisenbergiella merdipullorum TaxID=2838553 RepID=A0A9D2I393_9FIRM|nr:LysR family transcriptional regulator [Candidatus Eisenbergiella merdipullorum]